MFLNPFCVFPYNERLRRIMPLALVILNVVKDLLIVFKSLLNKTSRCLVPRHDKCKKQCLLQSNDRFKRVFKRVAKGILKDCFNALVAETNNTQARVLTRLLCFKEKQKIFENISRKRKNKRSSKEGPA